MQHNDIRSIWRRLLLLVVLLALIPAAALAKTGKVTCSSLKLRKSASTDSKVLQTLGKGDTVTIKATSGSWYQVTYGKYSGYVMKKYIATTKSSASAEKSSKQSTSSSKSSKIADLGSAPSPSKPGDSGSKVRKLQKALKIMGVYSGEIDGYYGDSTRKAVKKYQKSVGLYSDGIAGQNTISWLFNTKKKSSGDVKSLPTETLDWFKGGENKIPKGKTFKVKDIKTGKVFTAKRWSGSNHLDAEPKTESDAKTIKSIFGGWSWKRRAVLVYYNGHVYAASMNGMPHGTQTINDNGFDGHFCIHFYKSKTHGSKKIDSAHQSCVSTALKHSW